MSDFLYLIAIFGTPVTFVYLFKHYRIKNNLWMSLLKSSAVSFLFFIFSGMMAASFQSSNPVVQNHNDVLIFIITSCFSVGIYLQRKKNNNIQPDSDTESFGRESDETANIQQNDNLHSHWSDSSEEYELSSSGMSSGKRYKITYVDSNGKKTERVIKPFRIDKYYVDAYCELRREERTFSFDRIQQIIDISTGEIIIFPHAKSGDMIYQGKRGGYYAIDAKGKKKYLVKIGE